MRRIHIPIITLIAGFCMVFSTSHATESQGESALKSLKQRQRQIEMAQVALDENPHSRKHKAALNDAIRETFDFGRLGREAIDHTWDIMTPAQRKEYLFLFRELVQKSTVRKLKAYKAAGTKYSEPATMPTDSMTVTITTVVTSTEGDEVAILYKLHEVDGRWWIWDNTVGLDVQISEYDTSSCDNYRSIFNKIVKENGVEALLKKLRNKHKGGSEL
jgi:phospholipid transport system substrate-binding protein